MMMLVSTMLRSPDQQRGLAQRPATTPVPSPSSGGQRLQPAKSAHSTARTGAPEAAVRFRPSANESQLRAVSQHQTLLT